MHIANEDGDEELVKEFEEVRVDSVLEDKNVEQEVEESTSQKELQEQDAALRAKACCKNFSMPWNNTDCEPIRRPPDVPRHSHG